MEEDIVVIAIIVFFFTVEPDSRTSQAFRRSKQAKYRPCLDKGILLGEKLTVAYGIKAYRSNKNDAMMQVCETA
jgi:hypothetical protein